MNFEKRIIRLEANGPVGTGMPEMECDPVDFQSPLPTQHVHVYFEDQKQGFSVGVWDTTTMQEAFGPYPGDEFIWVLEGEFSMIDDDGNAVDVKQGESACFKNAIPVSWKQEGYLKKFYITYQNPKAKTPTIDSADGGVIVLDANAKMIKTGTDPLIIIGDTPPQHDHNFFTNDAEDFYVGMWDSGPLDSEMRPFPWHEFVQMLEGEVTITEEDGSEHTFKAGDCFFTPKGTVCSWKIDKYVKKFYAILETEDA